VIEWLTTADVLAIHDRQIAEHGGAEGTRDNNLLESALARPHQLLHYGKPKPDIAALAAAYAFGIARNHAFVDGNKRTSAVVTELFLRLNGLSLTASDLDIVQTWSELGAGRLTEPALAKWLRDNTVKLSHCS
jgi:death on curing protein